MKSAPSWDTTAGLAAVGATVLIVEVAGPAVHIQHRGQVDVQAEGLQVHPGTAARLGRLGGGASGGADLFLREQWRAREAADLPTFLVYQQQEGRLHRVLGAGGGLLQRLYDRPDLRVAGYVVGEEDHPGRLP